VVYQNMTAYRRYRVKGGCYFFTAALAEQWGSLLTENLEGLRAAFREVKQVHQFTMEAVVILPDHLHCIWTLLEGKDDFSTRWRLIKAVFSCQLSRTELSFRSRLNKGERSIWQTKLT
jgi:putative transposase